MTSSPDLCRLSHCQPVLCPGESCFLRVDKSILTWYTPSTSFQVPAVAELIWNSLHPILSAPLPGTVTVPGWALADWDQTPDSICLTPWGTVIISILKEIPFCPASHRFLIKLKMFKSSYLQPNVEPSVICSLLPFAGRCSSPNCRRSRTALSQMMALLR